MMPILLDSHIARAEFTQVTQEALAAFPPMLPVLSGELKGTGIVERHQLGSTVFSPGILGLLDRLGGYLDERPASPLSPILTSLTQAKSRIESGASRESVAKTVSGAIASFSQSVDADIAGIPPADLVVVTAAAYALGQMHSTYGASESTTTRLFKSIGKSTLGLEHHRDDLNPTLLFLNDQMVSGLAYFMLHRVDISQLDSLEKGALGHSFVRLGLLSGSLEWPTTFRLPNYAAARGQIYGDLDLTLVNHRDLSRPKEYITNGLPWRPDEVGYTDLVLASFLEGGASVFDEALYYVSDGLREMPRSFLLRHLQSTLERCLADHDSRDDTLKALVHTALLPHLPTEGASVNVASYLLAALG